MPRDRLKVMGKSLEGRKKRPKDLRAEQAQVQETRREREATLKEEKYEKEKTAPLIFPFFVTSCHERTAVEAQGKIFVLGVPQA